MSSLQSQVNLNRFVREGLVNDTRAYSESTYCLRGKAKLSLQAGNLMLVTISTTCVHLCGGNGREIRPVIVVCPFELFELASGLHKIFRSEYIFSMSRQPGRQREIWRRPPENVLFFCPL